MAGLDHTAVAESRPEDAASSARNSRYGLVLFAVYVALYGAFMAINAFAPSWMEADVGGINLAAASGLGLIGTAFLLALVYAWLCARPTAPADGQTQASEAGR
jgi:uncharacterized membrane protein (DUF485 family)